MTVGRTGVVPVSSTKTPELRLILPVRGSVLKASARPRIESGGAGMRASDGSDTGVTFRGAVERGAEASLAAGRGCGPVTAHAEPVEPSGR